MDSKVGQLLDVAYNIEYGAESSEQSSLNLIYLLGLPRPGEPAHLRRVEREVPRRGWQRPDHGAARRPARRPDHDRLAAHRDPRHRRRPLGADVQAGPVDEDDHRGPRRARAAVLDPARVGQLLARRLGAPEGGRGARAGHGDELEAARAVQEPPLACAGLQRRDVLRPRVSELVGGDARAVRSVRDPRQLHRRERRRELRERNAAVARAAVPRAGRAGPARDHEGVQRARRDRLLAGLRVDARVVLVLEGRSVHEVRRDGGSAAGHVPLRRRAHVSGLPGLPERCGRDGPARGGARSSPT